MRIDNKNPEIVYKNFWDWLLNYREHKIFIIGIGAGYFVYIMTTTEIMEN